MTDQQKSILIKQAFALIEEAYGEPALKMEITFRSERSAIVAAAQPKHEESFRRAEATTAVPGGDASTAQRQDASHQPKHEEGLRSALIKIAGDWKAAKTRNDGLHGKACVCQNCMTDFVWFKAASELETALAASPASGEGEK